MRNCQPCFLHNNCTDVILCIHYVAGTKEKIIRRMLRSPYSHDIGNLGELLERKFTSYDKPFELPKFDSVHKKEEFLPILFADYKDNFPYVDQFDFYMAQVRLLLRFSSQHQRFNQSVIWMGAVNAWALYVDAQSSARKPNQRPCISLRDFFSLIGKEMITHPEKFVNIDQ